MLWCPDISAQTPPELSRTEGPVRNALLSRFAFSGVIISTGHTEFTLLHHVYYVTIDRSFRFAWLHLKNNLKKKKMSQMGFMKLSYVSFKDMPKMLNIKKKKCETWSLHLPFLKSVVKLPSSPCEKRAAGVQLGMGDPGPSCFLLLPGYKSRLTPFCTAD